jgi:ABC-type uncharacterized transport system permease subunit
MTSSFLSITSKDVLKGFVVAVLTSIATAVIPVLQTGALPKLEQLHGIAIAGVAAGIAYLFKNFFTNSNDQMLKKEPDARVPIGVHAAIAKQVVSAPMDTIPLADLHSDQAEPTVLANEAAK